MQPPNPQTVVFPVAGIPYRCNTNISQLAGVRLSSYNEDFPFQQDENMDEADQNHEEIEFDKSTGKYTLSTYVPRKFYGNLIGKGREIQREIEINSKTYITIPHKQSSSEIVTIRGDSKASVIMGHKLINAKIDLAKQNLPVSHFFNIPLAFCESFVERMNEIIDSIFEKFGSSRGLDRSIVMDPKRMHLTLLCIKLFSSDDEIRAQQIFKDMEQDIKKIIGDSQGLNVHLKGLDTMNEDQSESNVLYIDVDKEHESFQKIQLIGSLLREKMRNAGFQVQEERIKGQGIKIHATLLNTKRRTSTQESGSQTQQQPQSKHPRRIPVDVRDIIAEFGTYDFGTWNISEVLLSRMNQQELLPELKGQRPHKGSGFYETLESINIGDLSEKKA